MPKHKTQLLKIKNWIDREQQSYDRTTKKNGGQKWNKGIKARKLTKSNNNSDRWNVNRKLKIQLKISSGPPLINFIVYLYFLIDSISYAYSYRNICT